MLRARLYYDTCAPLHPPVYMYVHVRDQNDNATYASTRWVPTIRHFLACEDVAGGSQQSGGQIILFCPDALPCVRRCSWWVPAVRGRIIFLPVIWTHFLACVDVAGGSQQSGETFFCEIRWPVRWVTAVRWRNHYFLRNKEALTCCGRGPSCQPLHVQYSSDGSRSLTTLTMPRREHQGDGRRRGLGRGRRGAGEDATVDAHAERSMRVH